MYWDPIGSNKFPTICLTFFTIGSSMSVNHVGTVYLERCSAKKKHVVHKSMFFSDLLSGWYSGMCWFRLTPVLGKEGEAEEGVLPPAWVQEWESYNNFKSLHSFEVWSQSPYNWLQISSWDKEEEKGWKVVVQASCIPQAPCGWERTSAKQPNASACGWIILFLPSCWEA